MKTMLAALCGCLVATSVAADPLRILRQGELDRVSAGACMGDFVCNSPQQTGVPIPLLVPVGPGPFGGICGEDCSSASSSATDGDGQLLVLPGVLQRLRR
jgi:hypothetical protein